MDHPVGVLGPGQPAGYLPLPLRYHEPLLSETTHRLVRLFQLRVEPELTEVALVDRVHERGIGVASPAVDEEVPPVDLGLLAQSPQREHLLGVGDLAHDAVPHALLAQGVSP